MALEFFALATSIFGFAAIKLDIPLLNRIFNFFGACLAISLLLEPLRSYQHLTWLPILVLSVVILTVAINSLIKGILYKTICVPLLFLVFLIKGEQLQFGEYQLNTASFSFIIHVLAGFFIPHLTYLKARLLNKWWNLNVDSVHAMVWPYILGILFFAGFFHYSFAGLLAVIIGLFSFALSDDERTSRYLNSLIFLSASMGFFGMSFVNPTSIISSNIFLVSGLSVGAFGLIRLATSNGHKLSLIVLISLLIATLSLLIPLYLGGKNSAFGGQGAFIVALFILGLLTTRNDYLLQTKITTQFFALTAGIALFIFKIQQSNYLEQGLKANFDNTTANTLMSQEFQQTKSSPLDGIIGDYSIAKEGLVFNFELGPKEARTKGSFKEIIGSVHIDKDISKSTFDIQLPVDKLTTFESSRDDALMTEYFFLDKFPKITFKSTTVKSAQDGFIVSGMFSMLGITKAVNVSMKSVGFQIINGKKFPVLKGIGSLDRTHFGMESDPSIGNVVDFNFSLVLKVL
jgi:polyisoprenoid-binding protein YceI